MNYDLIKKLSEERGVIVTSMQKLLDANSGGLDAEKNSFWDKMDTDQEALGKRIVQLQRADALEAEMRKAESIDLPKIRHSDDPETAAKNKEAEVKASKAAFEKFFRYGVQSLTAQEQALLRRAPREESEVRAPQTVTTTGGGYLIPQGFSGELEVAMSAFGGMLDPGVCRILRTEAGNDVPWPTVDDTSNVGELLAINAAAAELALTFSQVTLKAYKYSSKIVLVPNELLQDTGIPLEQLIRDAFAERLGRITNTHFTTGDNSGKPQGVVTGSVLGVTAAADAAVTFDELTDLEHSVNRIYRRTARWMFADSTLKIIKKLKDTTNQYLWQRADTLRGSPDALLGYPYTVNDDVAAMAASPTVSEKTILFGDFQKYLIRRVRDFSLVRLVERYAEYDQVGFIAFMRTDGRLLDAGTNPIKHLKQSA